MKALLFIVVCLCLANARFPFPFPSSNPVKNDDEPVLPQFTLSIVDIANTTVTVSITPTVKCTAIVEYWSGDKIYKRATLSKKLTLAQPTVFLVDNLSPDTNYTYRVHYFGHGLDDYTEEQGFLTSN